MRGVDRDNPDQERKETADDAEDQAFAKHEPKALH
jgi:hypothetical protein